MPPANDAHPDPAARAATRAADLVSRMTLPEKITQMTHDAPAIERLGIPAYNWWNECLHGVARAGIATVYPQAIGLAATFDRALMARIAAAIADEARAKHHDFIRRGLRVMYGGLTFWSPNVNIFRDPRWGRGQETYGEDPYLTARLGVAFVRGLQGDDPDRPKVIATPKHFAVHSGPEPERHRFDARVSERDLRETYLPAFEACIVEGRAGSIMPAYNRTNGEACAASPTLLRDILRGEWGFDGYVVSDCWAVDDIWRDHKLCDTVEQAAALAVRAGTDLNCGEAYLTLTRALAQGLVTEAEIDRAVTRLMTARARLGLLDNSATEDSEGAESPRWQTLPPPAHIALAREAAVKSIVLLKNDGLLPLDAPSFPTVALLGPFIDDEQALHGNYNGTPARPVTPRAGLAAALPAGVTLRAGRGCQPAEGWPNLAPVPARVLRAGAAEGLRGQYWPAARAEAAPALDRIDPGVDFVWRDPGRDLPRLAGRPFFARWSGSLTPEVSGQYRLALRCAGRFSLTLDGQTLLRGDNPHHPMTRVVDLALDAGRAYDVRIDCRTTVHHAHAQFLWATPGQAQVEREEALRSAAGADLIIACLGLSPELEGEEMPVQATGFRGGDRTDIALPAPQQDFLEALVALGKPVVLVLFGGSALSIPWAAERGGGAQPGAVLHAWYPGEQGGAALADLLLGRANPSGRLPVTVYRGLADLPAFEDYALDAAPLGRTYRYFRGAALYPFGHGLSYTRFAYNRLRVEPATIPPDGAATVAVDITNVGETAGDEVAQLYVNYNAAGRPRQELKGFARVTLQPGKTQEVTFALPASALRRWDGGWRVDEGEYALAVGASSGDLRVSGSLRVLRAHPS